MITYTKNISTFTDLTNNTSSANQTFGGTFINQYSLELIHKFPAIFTEKTFTGLQTFPSQQYYNISSRIRKISTLTISVGNTGGSTVTGAGFNWPVKEAPSLQFWNNLNLTNNISSDIPQYFIYTNGQLGIYPKPAAGYNAMTIRGQVEITSMSIADFTTGTIIAVPYVLTLTGTLASGALNATLSAPWTLPTGTYQMITSGGDTVLALFTNGSTAVTWTHALVNNATATITVRTANGGEIVTGSGTSWTSAMAGRVFQIAESASGDGFWYYIESVFNTTTLSLSAPYEGLAISAGSSAYTIGEVSVIPQAYQMLPIYRGAELYYTVKVSDEARRKKYKELGDGTEAALKWDMGNRSTDPSLADDGGRELINPNLALNLTGSSVSQ